MNFWETNSGFNAGEQIQRESREISESLAELARLKEQEISLLAGISGKAFPKADGSRAEQGYPSGITAEKNCNYPGLKIKAPGGHFLIWCGYSEAAQAGIQFVPDNDGVPVDIVLCEIKSDELAGKPDNRDVDVYVYADTGTEDYTNRFSIPGEDLAWLK